MPVTGFPKSNYPNAVDAARLAIWRLFQEGYVDEDMATASLLAVDLGTRRAGRGASEHLSAPRAKSAKDCRVA